MIRPASIARSTILNGLTQLVLILVSFMSYPVIAREVSADGFGLLAIVWLLVGYLGIFDLGLGWAATRSVALAAAEGNTARVKAIIWNAFVVGLILGIIIGVTLFLVREKLVVEVFDVVPEFIDDAMVSFALVSLAVPFAVVNGISRGTFQGMQRFDVMNTIQVGMALIQWGGSITMAITGYGVLGVTAVTVVARILFTCVSVLWQTRLVPGLMKPGQLLDMNLIREVMAFGGWITISRLISPLFLYLDRLIIGAVLSLQAVGFYTVPQETIGRLLIIPMSLTMTLFPAFSGAEDPERVSTLYQRALKSLLIVIVPLTLILVSFSRDLLRVWMGDEFSQHGWISFQILAVGFCFNALAQLPMTLLLSKGRPDLPAKFHMAEFPIVVIISLVLIHRFGISGVALAWTFRVIVDACLLFRSSGRCFPEILHQPSHPAGVRRTTLAGVVLASGFLVSFLVDSLEIRIGLAGTMIVAYGVFVWKYLLDESDRGMVTGLWSG